MKLSICMMVKNEEKNLPRCLDKLKPLTESGLAELIIVDTGSEDKTIEMSKQYTNNIYFHKWNKNFSEMRNISISYAKGEWIFIIDADERLDDVDKLISLFNSKEIRKYNTILLQVKNLYSITDESNFNLIVSPRIFRNDGKFRYEGAVHNQPIFKGPNLSVDISLTHYGYISNDKKLMELKYNRTTELLKEELQKEPENLYYLYQLGVSYDMYGEHKKSLEEFRKAYNILHKKTLAEKKAYVYIYASHSRIAYTNNELKETIKVAKEGLNLEKDYIDLYYLLGISERRLGNDDDAFNHFQKYLNLADRYNQLEISKNMTIIMYHIDDKSKSTAHFENIKYYLELEEYQQAYKLYKNVTSINEKIYSSINVLIPMKKYSELRKVYSSILSEKDKNTFLCTLEDKLKTIDDTEKENLYKEFSSDDDIYGLLNRIRISDNIDNKKDSVSQLIEKLDFDKEPIFYSEVFESIKDDIESIIGVFEKIEVWNLKNIVKYLVEEKGFTEVFENYILKQYKVTKNINKTSLSIVITEVLLLINLKDNDSISQKYFDLFKLYIEMGVNFVQRLYRIDEVEVVYKNIKNQQDRFFVVMYIIDKLIKEDNKKSAIKYMIEAVKMQEAFAKYIDIYKDEILFKNEEKIKSEQKSEFDECKNRIKDNINELINKGDIQEAKQLIDEYKKIVTDDIDIFSMDAVIAIIENNLTEAENILNHGLEKEPYNKELLLNMSYLMDITNNSNAVEYFCKAKFFNSIDDIKLEDVITNIKPMDINNLKVISGTMEIANQMNQITKGLKKIGVDAKTINYYPNYLGYKSDQVLDITAFTDIKQANIETKKLAAKLIADNDIFHFHFGTSLTLDYSDLPLIRELGKKSVMQYWGSDVRLYSKAKELNPYAIVKNKDEDSIKRNLELISKYIPDCIVDYELAEYVKGYHSNIYYSAVAMDLSKFKFINETQNKKLLIVHAPTSPEIKGTSYILKAIEELKLKYNFDFKLVQGMSNAEAKKIYEKADLIIDQILIGGYGVFAVESMAMGKPVIAWISDFMREKYPKELPIISANPDTIKDKIEFILNNRDVLAEIGMKSRRYAEEHHDLNKISENILDIYKKL